MTAPPIRHAVRGLVLAPTGHTLMMRGEDPADRGRGGFWWTPGGGREAGETAQDCLRRELREEVGLAPVEIGPVVMRRRTKFKMTGRRYHQEETIHLIAVDQQFTAAPAELSELELTTITDFRWLDRSDLASLGEEFYPLGLIELLSEILDNGPPDPPWIEDLIGER